MTLHIGPSRLAGTMPAPPSKSMAHRMLICAALARGFSEVHNLDYSMDIEATIGALEQLGARVERRESSVRIEGLPGGFATVTRPVDCRESGSTLRFMVPLFSLTGQQIRFVGAPYLFGRNHTAYADIFASQGLSFGLTREDLLIKGCLRPGNFSLPGNISSQFISGLLFALPLLDKDSTLHIAPPLESRSYIELTRAAQSLFGIESHWQDSHTLLIPGGQSYTAANTRVEGDWSNGAVPAVLGGVTGSVEVSGLNPESAQGDRVVLDILRRCGAEVLWKDGVLRVRPPKDGLLAPEEDVDLSDCPDLGPVLCTLALFCRGKTRFVNAGRLRIKECDRIACIQSELRKIGGRVSSTEDTIIVEGGYPLLDGKQAESHNDHRIVMALSAAALCGGISLTIQGANAITKSWPGYFTSLRGLGAQL